MNKRKYKGWYNQPTRHSLASRGVNTSYERYNPHTTKDFYSISKQIQKRTEDIFDVDLSDVDIVKYKDLNDDKIEKKLREETIGIPPAFVYISEDEELKVVVETESRPHRRSDGSIDWDYLLNSLSHELGHMIDYKLARKVSTDETYLSDKLDIDINDYTEKGLHSVIDTKERLSFALGKVITGEELKDSEYEMLKDYFEMAGLSEKMGWIE